MFGNRTRGGPNLVEFRAGRMDLIGTIVHPDYRKGLVYMHQADDGLMHFCWKDRSTGKKEEDLIVFPHEYEYKRVDQCKTGRVYVLKFKTSARRLFFWMQEPDTLKDAELCRRVNELINNPEAARQNSIENIQEFLNLAQQQQILQRLLDEHRVGLPQESLTTIHPQTTPAAVGAVISKPETTSNKDEKRTSNDKDNTAESGRPVDIDLSKAIVNSKAINEIITDPERVKKLSVHLPVSLDNDETKKQQIKDTIASVEFQRALSSFTTALQSAQLGPVVSQFELSTGAVEAAYTGNLDEFIKALQEALPEGTTLPHVAEKDVNEKASK